MNPSTMRRIGAALVVSLVSFPCFVPSALADDAPAPVLHHGSRAKAGDGTEVAYDAVNGGFIVLDRKNTFWVAPRFYHLDGGVWSASAALAGPWELVATNDVPQVARGHRLPPKSTVTVKLPSGLEAVYEPVFKAYRVAGRKGVFLFEGMFYRYDSELWLASKEDDGPWTVASRKVIPAPLRAAVPIPEAGQTVKLPTGETLVWDGASKVFTLQGKPETAFFEGTFYEVREKKWFSSPASGEAFLEAPGDGIPPPVRFKFRESIPLPKKQKADTAAAGGAGAVKRKPAADKKKPDAEAKAAQRERRAAAAAAKDESGE